MNRRGWVLPLVLVAISVLGATTLLVGSRTRAEISSYTRDDVRLQALWLARSALQAGVSGSTTVQTAHGEASVKVSAEGGGKRVVVQLAGARAEITSSPYVERFALSGT